MDLGTELMGCGAASRIGLQGVTLGDRAAASIAPADMHVEAAINHRAGNFRLMLYGNVRFAYLLLAAVRARRRQPLQLLGAALEGLI